MKIISEVEVPITPKMLAEAFWNLDSTEQAQFFSELHDLLEGRDWPAHGLGEMQWLFMSNEIEKSPKAKIMACTLATHIFLRASSYLEQRLPYP